MSDIIRFEQAVTMSEKRDEFEIVSERFQAITCEFSKSPLLQMSAMEIWYGLMDLSTYWASKDYSQMLLDKTNGLIKDFEDLQKDNTLGDVQKILIECIERANLRTKNETYE